MTATCCLKATSHSTIFDIPMRPVCEDQRYRRPAIPLMVIIPLNFACCTLPTHGNRKVKSSLKVKMNRQSHKR